MQDLYMKYCQGFMFVYCITSQASFNDLPALYSQLCHVKGTCDVPIFLVGRVVGVTCTEHNHPPDQASNKAKKLVSSVLKGQYSLHDFLDAIYIKNIKLDLVTSILAHLDNWRSQNIITAPHST